MNRNRFKISRIIGLLIMTVALAGCSSQEGMPDSSAQLEDMELVVTAQQGRVQNLEKQVADLESQLQSLATQLEGLRSNSSSAAFDPTMLVGIEDENRKLIRLLFQSFTGDLELESMSGLIDTYDNVFKMTGSYDESKAVLWITDGDNSGELYVLHKDKANLVNLGVFEHVSLVKWSPDNAHLIVETKLADKLKGYLIDVNNVEISASMEYTGLPIWSFDGEFFVYLNENPNVLYTGTETTQMHSTGVFMYDMSQGRFSVVDSGGVDYLCQDLSVDKRGEIKYVKQYKDGKQAFSSMKID